MLNTQLRWMIQRDRDAILSIDAASFAEPWDGDTLRDVMCSRNVIGMVAELMPSCQDDDSVVTPIVGFMVYELRKTSMEIYRLAVHPDCRRQGVGTQMLDRLRAKLSVSGTRRNRFCIDVPDDMLAAHLWLRANGVRANAWRDRAEYRFTWRVPVIADAASAASA